MGASQHIQETARALVEARFAARALPAFPVALPTTLDEAYAIQLAAIALCHDSIVGWKVGRLSPDLAQRFGADRFIGPIFAGQVEMLGSRQSALFPVFAGGSAAFEAEFVAFAGQQADGSPAILSLTTGIEVASSPVAVLPELGSLASVADLGNNGGLIIGAAVPAERITDAASLRCETRINDSAPVAALASALPGGPQAAFDFAVRQTALLGLPLREGQFVATGAVTGVHAVRPGQRGNADFGEFGQIACTVVERGAASSQGDSA